MDLSQGLQTAIKDIANNPAENGRSFFVYDLRIMGNKIKELQRTLPSNVSIYYAMKANPHDAFLKAAKDNGAAGIEIASMGEGQKAQATGFRADQIIFTGPGKSPEELEWSVAEGIKAVHVESLAEAHHLNNICKNHGKTQDILIRVNPNFHVHGAQANFSGESCKLGVDQDDFENNTLAQILELEHLNFKGLHVYSASGVLKVDDLIENCRRVFELTKTVEEKYADVHCDYIDFGGGFGIDYLEEGQDLNVPEYTQKLNALVDHFGYQDRKLVIELGRYLTADSGWYCTEILDIKTSMGKKQVIVQGGAHHLRRPVALGINHPIVIVPMNRPKIFEAQEDVKDDMVFVGGSLCNTADKLAPKDVHLKTANIGDVLVVGLAGGYGKTMSHLDFLSHPHPKEIVVF